MPWSTRRRVSSTGGSSSEPARLAASARSDPGEGDRVAGRRRSGDRARGAPGSTGGVGKARGEALGPGPEGFGAGRVDRPWRANARNYRVSFFYDLAKAAVTRMAFALAHEL